MFDKIAEDSLASQDKFELYNLLKVVDEINPQVILEIGVHKGYSAQVWRKAFKPDILIGLDNEPEPAEFKDFEFIVGDSQSDHVFDRVQSSLGGRKVDFLFIDGDHTYEGCKADYWKYSPLVRKGGIIAFHDINRRDPKWIGNVEVCRVWDWVKDRHKTMEFFNGSIEEAPGTGVMFV